MINDGECIMSNFVKSVKLQNFKKFTDSNFDFSSELNVLIGENDAGKSTILKAIDIVLNQSGVDDRRNRNSYGIFMNSEKAKKFIEGSQTVLDLPEIKIEVYLELNSQMPQMNYFYGENNSKKKELFGVAFKFSFDDQFSDDFNQLKSQSQGFDFVPFEFFTAKWETFAGQRYSFRKNPLKSIFIDTDKVNGDSFSSYTNQLFYALKKSQQNKLSIRLKETINVAKKFFNVVKSDDAKLGIDSSRLKVQDVLDVFSTDGTDIPLRDMGSGTENIIKTELAMNKTEAQLILVEEPENHLSFTLARQQIERIKSFANQKHQLILTTHDPLIVSRLNLKNIKWLNTDRKLRSFSEIDTDTANFFERLDNLNLLQMILAKKLVIVEGPTEYIVLESMFKAITGDSMVNQGVHIISMGGNLMKRFVRLSKVIGHKVLIITDNDGKKERVMYESEDKNITVVMPKNVKEFTFEVALYNKNKEFFKNIFLKKAESTTWKKHENLDRSLVYLLDNKVDSALQYIDYIEKGKIKVPNYIEEGIKWLTE